MMQHRLQLWNSIPNIQSITNKSIINIQYNNASYQIDDGYSGFDIIKTLKINTKNILAIKLSSNVDNFILDLNSSINKYNIKDNTYTIEPILFTDDVGKNIFWHSSAHVLGYALEKLYEGLLLTGPPEKDGFYYDIEIIDKKIDVNDLNLEINNIINSNYIFERKVISQDLAKEMFKDNIHKLNIINKLTDPITIYKCGDFIDLCKGAHISSTKIIKSLLIVNISNIHIANIKRVKGISFPSTFLMDQYNAEQKRKQNSSHQVLGQKQKLFFFHEYSPGSCFYLEHGTRMINKLTDIMRKFYNIKGFKEVVTPNIFKGALYKTSGHLDHYSSNMFSIKCDNEDYYLKPMNCPGHCLIFDQCSKSYNELPIRYADFGVLHRNELSGALTGLTRVRKFCQDDAHIFCTPSQIKSELNNCIEFLQEIYSLFGFNFKVELSTRPSSYSGNIELWNLSESILNDILNEKFIDNWKLNEGDGAFYGPKIDIHLLDKFNREHQCATIQLDFVLPEKFNLSYTDENNNSVRPVMIHRAIYGSIERFFALLIEHYEGIYPFWLSPRQIIVIPVHNNFIPYATEVQKKLLSKNYYVDTDFSNSTFNKKIALARSIEKKYNYIIIVGEKEVNDNTITVRDINGKINQDVLLDNFMKELD